MPVREGSDVASSSGDVADGADVSAATNADIDAVVEALDILEISSRQSHGSCIAPRPPLEQVRDVLSSDTMVPPRTSHIEDHATSAGDNIGT